MPKAPTLPPFSHAVCAPLVIEASGHPAQGRCTRDVQTLPGASRLGNAHEGDTVQWLVRWQLCGSHKVPRCCLYNPQKQVRTLFLQLFLSWGLGQFLCLPPSGTCTCFWPGHKCWGCYCAQHDPHLCQLKSLVQEKKKAAQLHVNVWPPFATLFNMGFNLITYKTNIFQWKEHRAGIKI